ncbi:hypothetical protein RCC30_19610 [Pseudomonas fluorescens]|nr:hypothetical protein RCC30_19610 [Pseudomonas fluorescens]
MDKIVYFSPSMCGAYRPEIHGSDMPADVVEVSESVWQSLLNELSTSPKMMSSRSNGQPVLIDPPALDAEALTAIERAWRDGQLALTDPLVSRHRDEIEEGAKPRSRPTSTRSCRRTAGSCATGRKGINSPSPNTDRRRRPGCQHNPTKRPALTGRFLFRYA